MTADRSQRAIRRLAQEIARPRREIESAFVTAGACLSRGYALLDGLGSVFDTLGDGLGGDEVADARRRLDEIATRTGALALAFEDEKRHLARLAEVIALAGAPIDDLIRSAKTMGIVSINARVTAVSLVEDSADLQIFSSDIATLSASAGRSIGDLAVVYGQLVREVTRAAGQRARFEAAHAGTLAELTRGLARTLALLDSQRDIAVESSRAAGAASREMAARIASAVMALQAGDAVRQRLEHVEEGLEAAAAVSDGGVALGVTVPAGLEKAATGVTLKLQAGQLDGAAAAYGAGVAQAQTDLRELVADAGRAMARARAFRGGVAGPTPAGHIASESVIADLGDQLRAAVSILHAFEAARARVDRVLTMVQEAVRSFLGHVGAVRDIEAEMRLVSLNATIRCAQLGPRAAGLSIIAGQLRELTAETVAAADAAMALLEESSGLAAAFGAASDEGPGGDGDLEAQARAALEILDDLDRRTARALGRLDADAPKAILQLEAAVRALAGQSAHADRLAGLAGEVLSCADAAGGDLPLQEKEGLGPLLAALHARYSMREERHIHEALFPAGHSDAVAAASEDEAELEDFLL